MADVTVHYDGAVISRETARELGLRRYFLGRDNPCGNGHVSERRVKDSACLACTAARVAAHKERHPNKVKAGNDARRKSNPDSFRDSAKLYRDRQRAAEGSHTAADIRRIHAEQGGKCACCGTPLSYDYHVDHIMPLTLGGSNWPDNLQALCEFCNISKNAKHPLDFSRYWFRRHGVWPLFAVARGWDRLEAEPPLIPTTVHSRGN
jgi:5-methylcytosine-specific restriction endonuclease McrA